MAKKDPDFSYVLYLAYYYVAFVLFVLSFLRQMEVMQNVAPSFLKWLKQITSKFLSLESILVAV